MLVVQGGGKETHKLLEDSDITPQTPWDSRCGEDWDPMCRGKAEKKRDRGAPPLVTPPLGP